MLVLERLPMVVGFLHAGFREVANGCKISTCWF